MTIRAIDGTAMWARHASRWRDPAQTVSQSESIGQIDSVHLRATVRGRFWEALDSAGITLIVSREYEHLLLALSIKSSRPHVTFMGLPHPSGIAVDRHAGAVFVASTRNPNQLYEFAPAQHAEMSDYPLVPVRSAFFPGSLYMHDLAFIGGRLYANAVGHNAVVTIAETGAWRHEWWPRSVESHGALDSRANYLQLNSIAAGPSPTLSFYSASSEAISVRRPGHRNYPVDGRGVIFSGETREPMVRGLTRPHSARLYGDRLWVANSGYGELSYADGEEACTFKRLPGWTRGLCFAGGFAFVGTSRVIPRFRAYAPGLLVDRAVCGVHAIEVTTGDLVGSIIWPNGNQIFGVDWLARSASLGFPYGGTPKRSMDCVRSLFYNFRTDEKKTWERSE